MRDDGRKEQSRWWEILIPFFVLVVGLNALTTPLGNGVYAMLGVLISTLAAWTSIVLVRRCGVMKFMQRLKRGQLGL